MALIDEQERFLQAIRAARGWTGQNKEEFTTLLFGNGSESTGDRLERGQIKKRTGSTEARQQLADLIIKKTGCPPGLFGLSEPEPTEVDRLKTVLAEQAKAQTRLSKELGAERKAREEMLTRIERLEHGGAGAR